MRIFQHYLHARVKIEKAFTVLTVIFASTVLIGPVAGLTPGELMDVDKIPSALRAKLLMASASEKFVVWVYFADRPDFDENPEDELPPVGSTYVDGVRLHPGVRMRFVDELQNALSVEATSETILQLTKLPFISRVEEVPRISTMSHHSANSHGALANPMGAIDVEDLHHAGYDGSGIRIAFLDSGVDMTHPALATKNVVWVDLVNGRPDPYDDNGHGTAVAALAVGFDGSAPYLGSGYAASLMAVKVVDQNFNGFMDTFNQGIQEVGWNADVISVSLGFILDDTRNCVVKDGRSSASIWTGWAVSNGRHVVVGAGNEGDNSDWCSSQIRAPGDGFNAITVGATDALGNNIAPFSSRGPTSDGRLKPDLVAPGENIQIACIALRPGCGPDRYITSSGTSYSTPLTAGAIASILEKSSDWSPAKVKAALRQTALDMGPAGPDNTYGYGLISASHAANAVVDISFAWDDGVQVQTSFASFIPRKTTDGLWFWSSIQSLTIFGSQMVGTYDIPWVESGLSGWVPLDHAILRAGPYIREATSTSLVFDTTYRRDSITYHVLARLTQISSTQVRFEPQLEATTIFSRAINARLYIDFDINGSCCDFFARTSDGALYTSETRIEATNVRVQDVSSTNRADISYNTDDNSPYEWLLAYPGSRDDPDSALNGDPNIYHRNVVFEYQSRRGSTPSGTTIIIGPIVDFHVSPGGGSGGSPHLSTFDGSSWILDNNVMPAAEHSEGRDVTDHYRIQKPLNNVQRHYLLRISEFENAHNFIDQVRLLTVDHSSGYDVAVSPTGQTLTYSNPIPAHKVQTSNGTDITILLSQADDIYYQQFLHDSLILNFSQISVGENAKFLIRSDPSGCPTACQKSWFDISLLASNRTWLDIADVFPRKYWSYDIIDLSPFLPMTNGKLVIRIGFDNANGHKIDFAGLDTTPPQPLTAVESSMTIAIHSTLGDVTGRVTSDDASYAEIVPGEYIVFAFKASSQTGQVRDFILIVNGYYVPMIV